MHTSDMRTAIAAGVSYLESRQLRSGAFRTYGCSEMSMGGRRANDLTPFATALILYSLDCAASSSIHRLVERGLGYLTSEMEAGGLWRYWSAQTGQSVPPDLDTTCCVSRELQRNGVSYPDNTDRILRNKDSEGRFMTWILEPSDDGGSYDVPPDQLAAVDPVVNANVLFYLGEHEGTTDSIAYLNALASQPIASTYSIHYPDALAFCYMLSRACYSGITTLKPAMPEISRLIQVRLSGARGPNRDLENALIVCSIVYSEQASDVRRVLATAIEDLITSQRNDGSWNIAPLYVGPLVYGSEELTTAFCIEALASFLTIA